MLKVICDDLDRNANLEYSIVEPITARDKTGNKLNNRAGYDFKNAFSINPTTGQIVVNEPLSYSSAAVIIVTVQVKGQLILKCPFKSSKKTKEIFSRISALACKKRSNKKK